MIWTSHFAHYRGERAVSVANSNPPIDGMRRYKALNPSWEIVQKYKDGSISWREFRRAYIKQLKSLNVHKVYRELNEKVLLCWEAPDKHCHREIIREWFNRNGYDCEELQAATEERTCSYCRHMNNHYSSSLCCELTGEILTNAQQRSQTCEDWRNRHDIKRSR